MLALALLAAVLLGRRLARPLERVADAATRLGDGDFSVRAPRAAIREVDAVAEALELTSARLADLVTRERAFSADASHQLRTPLAALRLELEALQLTTEHPVELERALAEVDRLQQTIQTLLAVARDHPHRDATCELVALLTLTEQRWHGRFADAARPLALRTPTSPVTVQAGDRVVSEIIDVLLDNAARHGQGKVEIAVDTVDDNWAGITVSDEGPGFALDEQATFQRRSTDIDGHGIGLALARSLARAEGGRLAIPNRGPAPRITLTLRTSTSSSQDHQRPAERLAEAEPVAGDREGVSRRHE